MVGEVVVAAGGRVVVDARVARVGSGARVPPSAAAPSSTARLQPATGKPARASTTTTSRRGGRERRMTMVTVGGRRNWHDLAGTSSTCPEHVVLPPSLTGVESPIIVVFGDRFPMITRPQGPRRLRLPGAAHRDRPVRPDPAAGDLAVDRQLRPGRRRHQPDHGQPRRGHPARGHEPGALRLARPLVRGPGRRRHPHAGHGVQRQGDLRRLQRAGARSRRTSCSTSSASSATTSGTTRSPAGRWSTCSTRSARDPGMRLAAFVSATGLGGHDRRRRPAEGHVRHAHRRRRGAGVPDDAGERLRRAQHPGHRRQAHPADPQRHEHRRRRRRVGPGHRRARPAVQLRRRAGPPRRPQGRAGRGHRRPGPLRVLVDVQRAGRHQDGQAARLRARRRHRHRGHRRRRDVPERAGRRCWPSASAASSPTSTPPRRSAATSPTSTPTTSSTARPATAPASSTSATTPGSSSRARRSTLFEQRREPGLLARPAPLPRRVGRDDHRVQRPGRAARDPRLAVRRVRHHRRHRHAVPVHRARGRRRPTATTSCTR